MAIPNDRIVAAIVGYRSLRLNGFEGNLDPGYQNFSCRYWNFVVPIRRSRSANRRSLFNRVFRFKCG